ncbi:ParM/StbA family protein [Paenibacillus sp. Leaf72]|uniref:ParM/StbA family protein n=1 Tax=Paenibacillus sp. Leaf72 TaxID=1736234 RepID=UPI0006FD2041|nr:ParM/StbA family protein [Paenibacillus sp. Leaf72]KQN97015.1 hypothetical protein ASF12_23385 [Paenibacillus sp. Leaf72]
MFKIAIDLGYGFVKGINDRGDRICFPSLVAPAFERNFTSAFGVLEDPADIHTILNYANGNGVQKDLFMGNLALKSSKASYSFDKNKIDTESTQMLLATAASMLTANVNEPIHLITGLPLDYYITQQRQFEESLLNFYVALEHFAGEFKGHRANIKFDKVTVYLQGGASIYPCLMDVHGMPKRRDLLGSGELLAVVNLGFYTLDVIVFQAGQTFEPKEEGFSFSLDTEVGMAELRKMAGEAFFQKTKSRLTMPQIEAILKKGGKQTFEGINVDISDEISAFKATLAQVILNHIRSKWGSQQSFIHTVFFCGGGAEELRPHLEGFHYNQEIIEESQFADAVGYLIHGRIEEYKAKMNKIL